MDWTCRAKELRTEVFCNGDKACMSLDSIELGDHPKDGVLGVGVAKPGDCWLTAKCPNMVVTIARSMSRQYTGQDLGHDLCQDQVKTTLKRVVFTLVIATLR